MALDELKVEEFLGDEPIVREKSFRAALDDFSWNDFKGKDVVIRGCSSGLTPVWAYLMIASRLQGVAKSISYGDSTNPVAIWPPVG